jgi:hypothetical protein
VEESANQVGRALHAVSDPGLTAAVLAEVQAELTAVEDAERGHLTGRAQQAVLLTREDASPVQVAAANRLLAHHPQGTDELFLSFDPTAAAIAAAHWLTAAADVVAEISGIPAHKVVERADDLEALPHATPTAVLELIGDGLSPATVVLTMIQEAMLVAEGELLLSSAAADNIVDAHTMPATPGAPTPPETVRVSALDPRRPARDLLEDLLAGIRGCQLLYTKYDTLNAATPDDDITEQAGSSFDQAVRERAAATQHRLN